MILVGLFLCLLIAGLATPVLSKDEPYNPYGGGIVYGRILGFNLYDELIPVTWADISAYHEGEFVAKAYSMGGGYYEIILPVGWYKLTVEQPGYKPVTREIFVSSASSTAINFVLKLSGEPIYKPKPEPPLQYVVKIAVSGLPAGIKTQLYVDGAPEVELGDGETFELKFEIGTAHTISVQEKIERDGERYIIDEPTLSISTEASHEFRYNTKYLLNFVTDPEELSLPSEPQAGWYPAETIIITPTAPPLIEEQHGVRYRFEAWSLDNQHLEGNPITFKMDKPHLLKVTYSKEYLIEITSPYGTPTGSGWYQAGSTATISIQSSEGLLIKQVFTGWSGDYIGREPTATITVNKPMQITANWTTDYTILILLIAIAAALIVSAALILRYRKPQTTNRRKTAS